MATTTPRSKNAIRKKRASKTAPMTKLEMIQKMLADQKIIREAIQNGIPLTDLEKTHGFKFARLPKVKDQ